MNNTLTVLTISLTWNCPVKCDYCHITSKASLDDKEIISRENLIQELKIAIDNNIDEIRFSGGEPVVIGDKLFEYADIVYDITGKKTNLLTSGIGINSKWLSKAKNKFLGIYVSVENPIEQYQTVVNNASILNSLRKIYLMSFHFDMD